MAPSEGPAAAGQLPGRLAFLDEWSDGEVADAGLPVERVRLVTVGGGLASFALLDQLRIRGTPAVPIWRW